MAGQTRREFLAGAGRATAATGLAGLIPAAEAAAGPRPRVSANERLSVAVVGVANRGAANLQGVSANPNVDIVALVDIDDTYLSDAASRFPRAKTYNDYREMLERKDVDAVVVSTPDHMHAPVALEAMKSGRHVYCEKPLAHTVYETRTMAQTAKKHRRVTQMGTQIHAGSNYRRVVELVQGGAIGTVEEVHVWSDSQWSGGALPTDTPPVPPNIHWDLWLGVAPARPYSPVYIPARWRGWWAFGSGTLGDMACHHIDLSHWALHLRYPKTVRAEGPAVDAESAPPWLIVHYEYPEREAEQHDGKRVTLPAVRLTWYNSGKRPQLITDGAVSQATSFGQGTLFVGSKGMLLADYDRRVLLPEDQFRDYQPPTPWIPDSIGHHNEWVQACLHGGETTCNFDYSGALAEAVLLGNVAYRTGQELEWDPKSLRAANCPAADALLKLPWRAGYGA